MHSLKNAWLQAGTLLALLVCGMLPAGAQTWQAQARKTPVVVENSACNAATDKLGITAAPVSILVCKNGVWSKQDGEAVVTPLYLRNTGAEPAACPSSWVQADIGYVHESASGGNYVRTCLPPSTQSCSVMYLKNANGAPAACPATWSQADLASVSEGGTANTIRACVSCAVQPNSCTGPECTVTPASSCTVPWGGVIAHGTSVTAYASATVPYGNTCQAQTRTCSNGVLSGSNTVQACTVSQEPVYGWVDDPDSPIYGWVDDPDSPIYGWVDDPNSPIYGLVDDLNSPIYESVEDRSRPIYETRTVQGAPIYETQVLDFYGDIELLVVEPLDSYPDGDYPSLSEPHCTDGYEVMPESINREGGGIVSNSLLLKVTWTCVKYSQVITGYGQDTTEQVLVGYEKTQQLTGYKQIQGITGYKQIRSITGYKQIWDITGYKQVWDIIGYR